MVRSELVKLIAEKMNKQLTEEEVKAGMDSVVKIFGQALQTGERIESSKKDL